MTTDRLRDWKASRKEAARQTRDDPTCTATGRHPAAGLGSSRGRGG